MERAARFAKASGMICGDRLAGMLRRYSEIGLFSMQRLPVGQKKDEVVRGSNVSEGVLRIGGRRELDGRDGMRDGKVSTGPAFAPSFSCLPSLPHCSRGRSEARVRKGARHTRRVPRLATTEKAPERQETRDEECRLTALE